MRSKYDVLLGDVREMDDSAVSMSTTDRMSVTPNPGEFIYDETEKKLYVGDGETVGGVEVLNGNVSECGPVFPLPLLGFEMLGVVGMQHCFQDVVFGIGENMETLRKQFV